MRITAARVLHIAFHTSCTRTVRKTAACVKAGHPGLRFQTGPRHSGESRSLLHQQHALANRKRSQVGPPAQTLAQQSSDPARIPAWKTQKYVHAETAG